MTDQARKISDLISEMARGFISAGETPEEKQSRLAAACSAWNMACASREVGMRMLERYVDGYHRFNPVTTPGELAKVKMTMESLIERKLNLFADDRRQIISAKVVMVGADFRIEVASARL